MKAALQLEGFKKEIKKIIKESIKQEMMELKAELLPYISNKEQQDIEKLYKKPNKDIAKSVRVTL